MAFFIAGVRTTTNALEYGVVLLAKYPEIQEKVYNELKSVFKNGFRDSLPTMPETVHKQGSVSDQEAVEQLTETIHRFKNHSGPFHASPLYGDLNPEDHLKQQLVHCEHHLGFLSPQTP